MLSRSSVLMDAFSEIGVFVRVVEARGFSRAAERLDLTPSGVSRIISRLEARLGVRLLQRTTRSLSLTEDGSAYYERCRRILDELGSAELELAKSRSAPRGRIRVDAPVALGEFVIGPALPQFLKKYPEVSVDMSLRDQLIDPTAEGVDVVVRMAELRDSELLAKRLGVARRIIAGSPAYLRKHGRPKRPADLQRHACIGYLSSGAAMPWRFGDGKEQVSLEISGRLNVNSGSLLRQSALAGLGLVQVFSHHVQAELESGALECVLQDFEPAPRAVHALYGRHVGASPKVRAFLGFLQGAFRAS